jgi:uncharacterized membrane protein
MPSPFRNIFFFASIFLLICLRFWNLGSHSIWTDEQDSLMQSRHLAEIWPNRGNGVLYFVILNFWRAFFGDTATALRSLSAVLGVLSVAVTGWIVLRITRDRLLASIALFLGALFPILLWHARDARMYSLWGFAFVLALNSLLDIREKGITPTTLFHYTAAHLIAILSHSYHALYLIPFLPVTILARGHRLTRNQLLMLCTPVLLVGFTFLLRLTALSNTPGSYLISHGYRTFDFRLLASLTEIFTYENPAAAQFGNTRFGLLILIALVALSTATLTNRAIPQGISRSIVVMFWAPLLVIHLLPVRDSARLFTPVALLFPILATLAAHRPEWPTKKSTALNLILCGVCLAVWYRPIQKVFVVDMESWKSICLFLKTIPEEIPIVSELDQPESPVRQCGLSRRILTHRPHEKVSTTLLQQLEPAPEVVLLRSPPWVERKKSLLQHFETDLYESSSHHAGPYLYRFHFKKKKMVSSAP